MVRADASFRTQGFQSYRLFLFVLINDMTNSSHQLNLGIVRPRPPRMTSATSAKAGLLGGFGNLEEAHLLASRSACGTRRSAIDSRRADRENKAAVARAVAGKHRIPQFRIVHYACHCCSNLEHFTSPLRDLMRPIIGRTRDAIYPMFAAKLELEYFPQAKSYQRHAQ